MDLLPLNFPVFNNCIVKGNTNLHQYDAVSILLLGRLRKDSEDIYIRDAEATGYINGEKNIKKEILNQVTRISKEEAIKRIDGLGFQDLAGIANAARELLTIVNIPPNTRQKIENDQDDLSVIADTFMVALKCPPKSIYRLGFEEKARLALCYSKENPDTFMSGIRESRSYYKESSNTPKSTPKSGIMTTEEIEALLNGSQEAEEKKVLETRKQWVSSFSEEMPPVPCAYYYQDNSYEMNMFLEFSNIALSAGITALGNMFYYNLDAYGPTIEIYDRLSFFLSQFQDDETARIFYKFTVASTEDYHIPNEIGISGLIMVDMDSDDMQELCDNILNMDALKFISYGQKLEFQLSLQSEIGSAFSGHAATAISDFVAFPVTIKKISEFEIQDTIEKDRSAIIGVQQFSFDEEKRFCSRLIVPLDMPNKIWKLCRE